MIFTLLGGVVIGAGLVGVALLAFRAFGRKAPRWLAPTIVGLSMFTFQLWNEYTWFARTAAQLPDYAVVAETTEYSGMLPPWTLLVPRVTEFVALDLQSRRRNEATPQFVLLRARRFVRPNQRVDAWRLYDCGRKRWGRVVEGDADSSGLPPVDVWRDDGGADTACGAEGESLT